jgi:Cu/Ag efflux protein CusF
MANGQPVAWWRPGMTHWFGLPSMTIDRGRDARMSVVRLDMGLTTWADEHSKEGAFWKKEITARVKEVAFAKYKVWLESKALSELTTGEMTLAYEEVIKRPNTTLLIGAESDNAPANQNDQ